MAEINNILICGLCLLMGIHLVGSCWKLVQTPKPKPSLYNAVNDVLSFHRAIRAPLPDRPHIPSPLRRKLREDLLTEERVELEMALAEFDLPKIADGCADTIYVIIGLALEWGIDLAPVWDEVQRTNMAKLNGPTGPNGKQLKPEGWQPPDIRRLLRDQPLLSESYQ